MVCMDLFHNHHGNSRLLPFPEILSVVTSLQMYICMRVHGSFCVVVSVCSLSNEQRRLCVLPFSLSLYYTLNIE